MYQDKYVFIPSFSLEPNKVVSYNSVFVRDYENEELRHIASLRNKKLNKFININSSKIIKKDFHNFKISENAYRNLKRKINWLYYLSKSKKVKTYNGKEIYNFKVAFITLTLPAKQKTPTATVTKELLNNFLTEVRQRTEMINYVWRLEFQKNGNVHYHLITDTYLDYFFIKKIWNRLLKSKGYIKEYQEKMNRLTLSEYNNVYNQNSKIEFNKMAKRYARNKRENWSNPPSVDVKSVISDKAIANYISKYFSKNSIGETIKNELDNEGNSKSLRLWYCSRSLSKMKTISNFCEAVLYDIFAIVSFAEKTTKIIGKYATSIYFEIKELPHNSRKWIEMIFRDYSQKQGYVPSL